MTERPETYDRAVELFGRIVGGPGTELCRKPADLVRVTGRSPSTGFRMVADAETLGLVSREIDQTYGIGPLGRRIGFSALGFGDFSDISAPLLRDLREKLRRTAVIAFLSGQEVRLGLWSIGRGTDYVRPERQYFLDVPLGSDPVDCVSLSLHLKDRAIEGEQLVARAISLGRSNGWICLIGVLLPRLGPTGNEAIDPELQRLAALLARRDAVAT